MTNVLKTEITLNTNEGENKMSKYFIFEHPFLKTNSEKNRHERLYFQKLAKKWSRESNGMIDCFNTVYLHYDEADYEIALQDVVQSKESYMEWLSEWRDCYKFLTKEIRHAKANRKQNHPDKSRPQCQWIARSQNGRQVAKRLNIMRAVAKRLSWNKKLEGLELREVA